jgi:hypothetical protein
MVDFKTMTEEEAENLHIKQLNKIMMLEIENHELRTKLMEISPEHSARKRKFIDNAMMVLLPITLEEEQRNRQEYGFLRNQIYEASKNAARFAEVVWQAREERRIELATQGDDHEATKYS